MSECKKQDNLKKCNCTYPGCERKGVCCLCLQYHLSRKELPACCFDEETEKSFDRSFKKFAELVSKGKI
jgi:hypothetical protein